FLAGAKRRDLAELIFNGNIGFPPHSEVHCQPARDAPVILKIEKWRPLILQRGNRRVLEDAYRGARVEVGIAITLIAGPQTVEAELWILLEELTAVPACLGDVTTKLQQMIPQCPRNGVDELVIHHVAGIIRGYAKSDAVRDTHGPVRGNARRRERNARLAAQSREIRRSSDL